MEFEKSIVVPGDESCLFTSVANSLIQRVQCGDMLVSDIFARFGVPDEHFTDVEYIRQVLRVKMVEEWNVNTEYYQGFLTVDLTSVSQDFLDNTQFSGSAGDLMALTLATNAYYHLYFCSKYATTLYHASNSVNFINLSCLYTRFCWSSWTL